jgi:hypothetical protein
LRSSVFAVKPGLVPTLGMTRQLGLREGSVSSPLNRNAAKFYTRTVGELGLMIDVEKLSKEKDSWFCLEVYFAKDLELAEVGDGIGTKILWPKVEEIENITKEF